MTSDPSGGLLETLGITAEEYDRIKVLLGRVPNGLELGMFSVMWSEHCSYKSSRIHLRRFPTQGKHVIQGPGENAGVVDIGDGLAAVFKIESHNHPSFIEPYQGAATGVGGILRDIFTMGARPVAFLNSLRFGPLTLPKNRYLFEEVVSGIAGYGNCVGIPTVGGEIYFNEIYNRNPLVNVFCLGIARREEIVRGAASGVENAVIYIGSKTGRDGIHGATMASESFDQAAEEKRPTVQVGDPFLGKLLLEASLEIIRSGSVEGIQDMGAAGLTSSSVEMAWRAGTGIQLEMTSIPLREEGMNPEEIMLSESQERMLLVAKAGRENQILEICRKWDLDGKVIGKVTDDGIVRVTVNGETAAAIPAKALTEEAPEYQRPITPPSYLEAVQSIQWDLIPVPGEYGPVLLELLSSPGLAGKQWVYEQFDHMVRTNTVLRPGGDAAVLRIKGSQKSLAMTVDGNSLYTMLNPYQGGTIAVCEAARNLACSGAEPVGMTDCLNFANPERPDVMWQFSAAVEGISDAGRYLEIPVISGNVSFYNETEGIGIYPTPVIGMVGVIESADRIVTPGFKNEADILVLLGETLEELGGSEYLRVIHSREGGFPPKVDLSRERAVQRCCLAAIEAGIINSAHDCSEGGLAVAIAESCLSSQREGFIGAEVELTGDRIRSDALLFGESQSRIIVTVGSGSIDRLKRMAESHRVPLSILGRTGGSRLIIRLEQRELINLSVPDIHRSWREALPKRMSGEIHV